MKSLAKLSSITKLVLNSFLRSVALDRVWQNLTFDMNHLKILGLEIFSYELVEVSCAICLIRSAPNLESLSFIISARDQQILTTALYLEQQQEHSISFSGLKKAPALEKFIIPPGFEGSYFLEELVSMPKASPKVEIALDHTESEVDAMYFA